MSGTPELLGGRYEVGKGIGRGGMAEVHLGRDLRLGRTVAIKVLRADLARDPAFQARFRREAQSAASLNHPAIVAVYDTGEDAVSGLAVPFIVMEYVEGSTLRELLSTGRRLVPARAMEVTAAVLTALEYSHRQGIVHRDIKPGNVMLTSDGSVKVMDFGIARALADTGAMTQTAAVMGTAQYLSPEQARGEQVDARSDLYSTGCLLYELLTGRPPFTGDSPVSVAYQHVREEAPPPSSVDREVPAVADAVTMKALAKDREHRYQTAADFRADLERAISGQPVLAGAALGGAVAGSAAADSTQRLGATTALAPVPGGTGGGYGAPPEDPDRPARNGSFWTTLVLSMLAVFALAAIVGYFVFNRGDDPDSSARPTSSATAVTVPNVVGDPFDVAEQQLENLGFEVERKDQQSAEDENEVLSQDPSAHRTAPTGTTVVLTVSSGPGTVPVPELVGRTRSEAEDLLRASNLEFTTVRVNSEQEEGEVVSTTPEAGTKVAPGRTVTLRVASGRNDVPNVVNQSLEAARQELVREGFTVEVQRRNGPPGSANKVFEQNPSGGETEDLGTLVTITVGLPETSSPSPSTASPTPTVSISNTPTATAQP